MHLRFNFDACPMHSPSGFVHLTHQNLSARALFCLNSLAKVNTQLLIYNYMLASSWSACVITSANKDNVRVNYWLLIQIPNLTACLQWNSHNPEGAAHLKMGYGNVPCLRHPFHPLLTIPFFFFFLISYFYLGVHSSVITCSPMKPRAGMYRTVWL